VQLGPLGEGGPARGRPGGHERPGVIEVVVATVGLRLGVLNTATYTIVILVAIVTSVMAPPLLRVAMARVEQTAEEYLRQAAQPRRGRDERAAQRAAPDNEITTRPVPGLAP
jgi:hypothetical protein